MPRRGKGAKIKIEKRRKIEVLSVRPINKYTQRQKCENRKSLRKERTGQMKREIEMKV